MRARRSATDLLCASLLLLIQLLFNGYETAVAARRRLSCAAEEWLRPPPPLPPPPACLAASFSCPEEVRRSPAALARLLLWLSPPSAAPGRSLLLFEAGDALLDAAPRLEAHLAASALLRVGGDGAPPFLLGCSARLSGGGGAQPPTCRAVRGWGARASEPPVAVWLLGSAASDEQGLWLAGRGGSLPPPPPAADGDSACAAVRAAEAALWAAAALPPAPAAVFLIGPAACGGASLAGFPPWLAQGAELYAVGPLAALRRAAVERALRCFARTEQRGGR